MPESRQYELVYVVAPDGGEDAVNALHTEVEEIVTGAGGRIEKTDNWGSRRLAYEIGKHREGTYVVELIEGARRGRERAGPQVEGAGQPPAAPGRPCR